MCHLFEPLNTLFSLFATEGYLRESQQVKVFLSSTSSHVILSSRDDDD